MKGLPSPPRARAPSTVAGAKKLHANHDFGSTHGRWLPSATGLGNTAKEDKKKNSHSGMFSDPGRMVLKIRACFKNPRTGGVYLILDTFISVVPRLFGDLPFLVRVNKTLPLHM